MEILPQPTEMRTRQGYVVWRVSLGRPSRAHIKPPRIYERCSALLLHTDYFKIHITSFLCCGSNSTNHTHSSHAVGTAFYLCTLRKHTSSLRCCWALLLVDSTCRCWREVYKKPASVGSYFFTSSLKRSLPKTQFRRLMVCVASALILHWTTKGE
jgi:hypothetical protein